MSAFRKNWLLALCLGLMSLVAIQTGLCAAEHAGLLPCTELSSEHGESGAATGEPSGTHCCHAHSHSGFLTTETAVVIFGFEPSERFAVFQDPVPDALVREIEYPPQLA